MVNYNSSSPSRSPATAQRESSAAHQGLPPKHPFVPGVFFGFLFGPAISVLLIPLMLGFGGSTDENYGHLFFVAIIAVIGTLVSAIGCAVHFIRYRRHISKRGNVAIGIVLGLGCGLVSLALCVGGIAMVF